MPGISVPTVDTETGKVYPSRTKAGKAVALDCGLDPLNNFVYYQVHQKYPKRLRNATQDEIERT